MRINVTQDRPGKHYCRSSASSPCVHSPHHHHLKSEQTHRPAKGDLLLFGKRSKWYHHQARKWGPSLGRLNSMGAWQPELTKLGTNNHGDTFCLFIWFLWSCVRLSPQPQWTAAIWLASIGHKFSFIAIHPQQKQQSRMICRTRLLRELKFKQSHRLLQWKMHMEQRARDTRHYPWGHRLNCVSAAWNIAHYLSHFFCTINQTRLLIYHEWVLLYALEGSQRRIEFTVDNIWLLVSYWNA